jgi:hypothetical protein
MVSFASLADFITFSAAIIKTLRKEHCSYAISIAQLQQCIYWFDTGHLAKVKRALEDGLLG